MEGLLIGSAEEGSYMNRRGEWGQNLPPTLEVTDPDEDWRPSQNHNPEKAKRKSKSQGAGQGKASQNESSQIHKKRKVDIPTNEHSTDKIFEGQSTSKLDMFELGGTVAPKSWEMVRLEAKNTSILQFFEPKGPPLRKLEDENRVNLGDFGDLGSNSGVKGQGEKVKLNQRTDLDENPINTSGPEAQASFNVVLLNKPIQLRKSNNP